MATSKIYLDSRRNMDGFGIIKILVIHNRIQRMYSTGVKIKEEDFKKFQTYVTEDGLSGKVKNEELIYLHKLLYGKSIFNNIEQEGYLLRSKTIISELGNDFTFEKFKYRFDNFESVKKRTASNDIGVFVYFDNYIRALKKEERIGSALAYQSAANSIKRFLVDMTKHTRYELNLPVFNISANIEISFDDISVAFLEEYEKWMLKCGKKSQSKDGINTPASITSVGVNLRHLRSIFNVAKEDKITSNYPFGKKLYQIPASNNTKKALSKSDIQKILSFQADSNTMEKRSHDLWVFSYLGNGINFADICLLRKVDFDKKEKSLTFVREKTKRTNKRNQKSIKVYLDSQQLDILERWKAKSGSYLFEFLQIGMDATKIKSTITQLIHVTNKHIRNIGKKLEIQDDITTYTARHSFATILLRSEAPIAFISKSLGHASLQTTESYLGSFEEEKVKEYLKALR